MIQSVSQSDGPSQSGQNALLSEDDPGSRAGGDHRDEEQHGQEHSARIPPAANPSTADPRPDARNLAMWNRTI
jgi:hypothetical protein